MRTTEIPGTKPTRRLLGALGAACAAAALILGPCEATLASGATPSARGTSRGPAGVARHAGARAKVRRGHSHRGPRSGHGRVRTPTPSKRAGHGRHGALPVHPTSPARPSGEGTEAQAEAARERLLEAEERAQEAAEEAAERTAEEAAE